jgi:hypothetical protein
MDGRAQSFLLVFCCPFREVNGGRVDVVAQSGRLRAVGKDMTEMGIAGGAAHLGPAHEERAVGTLAHRDAVDRGEKARLGGAGIELGVGGEQ